MLLCVDQRLNARLVVNSPKRRRIELDVSNMVQTKTILVDRRAPISVFKQQTADTFELDEIGKVALSKADGTHLGPPTYHDKQTPDAVETTDGSVLLLIIQYVMCIVGSTRCSVLMTECGVGSERSVAARVPRERRQLYESNHSCDAHPTPHHHHRPICSFRFIAGRGGNWRNRASADHPNES